MGRVEAIEHEIQKLSARELEDFREWFAQYDADAWDRKFEADVQASRLESLADRALADHQTQCHLPLS